MTITDAQVKAALTAYADTSRVATGHLNHGLHIEAMRAALEAATALTGPVYEYRRAWEDGTHAWPFGHMDTEEGETLEAVQRVPQEDEQPEYFDGTRIERRTKAVPSGEWEKA